MCGGKRTRRTDELAIDAFDDPGGGATAILTPPVFAADWCDDDPLVHIKTPDGDILPVHVTNYALGKHQGALMVVHNNAGPPYITYEVKAARAARTTARTIGTTTTAETTTRDNNDRGGQNDRDRNDRDLNGRLQTARVGHRHDDHHPRPPHSR